MSQYRPFVHDSNTSKEYLRVIRSIFNQSLGVSWDNLEFSSIYEPHLVMIMGQSSRANDTFGVHLSP